MDSNTAFEAEPSASTPLDAVDAETTETTNDSAKHEPERVDAEATETNNDTAEKEPERVYDLYSWKVKAPHARMVYLKDPRTTEEELAKLQPGPLGFDLEWKPIRWKGGYNRVALVQLASHDTILLIQVIAMQVFPNALKNILEDPAFLKAGVGIQGDCKKLWEDWRVSIRNCVDLALLARTVDNARWKGKYTQAIGLARLCRVYEELDLAKGKTTRSNWELHLSEIQQEYAANDCHSGLALFRRLDAMKENVDPVPRKEFYSFDFFEGYLYHPSEESAPVQLWHPHNPHYDPGPPPEPKEQKDDKDKKDKRERRRKGAEGSARAVDEPSAQDRLVLPGQGCGEQSQNVRNGPRNRYHPNAAQPVVPATIPTAPPGLPAVPSYHTTPFQPSFLPPQLNRSQNHHAQPHSSGQWRSYQNFGGQQDGLAAPAQQNDSASPSRGRGGRRGHRGSVPRFGRGRARGGGGGAPNLPN